MQRERSRWSTGATFKCIFPHVFINALRLLAAVRPAPNKSSSLSNYLPRTDDTGLVSNDCQKQTTTTTKSARGNFTFCQDWALMFARDSHVAKIFLLTRGDKQVSLMCGKRTSTLKFHSTSHRSNSQIFVENCDFCLPHLHSTSPSNSLYFANGTR